tara:strand:+ start:137 stop:319 length:183 start_codon:yes stop_codon:yes gene_type:complete
MNREDGIQFTAEPFKSFKFSQKTNEKRSPLIVRFSDLSQSKPETSLRKVFGNKVMLGTTD